MGRLSLVYLLIAKWELIDLLLLIHGVMRGGLLRLECVNGMGLGCGVVLGGKSAAVLDHVSHDLIVVL